MTVGKIIWNYVHGARPAVFMVIVQVVFAGVNVLYKLAVTDGMSPQILVAYRFSFAAALMLPLALLLDRQRPNLTRILILQAFLCGLFGGSLAQNLYVESLALTSATFVSATNNLVPAVTYILAISFGLEKVGLGTNAGKAKVLGTLMGIGGAMVLTFYKGVQINFSTHTDLLNHHSVDGSRHVANSEHHFLGMLLALASCFSYSLWLIIQAKMMERYPYHYTCTALMCTMAAIQAMVFALCTKRDLNQWKLGWDVRLLTVSYSGIVASGLTVTLMAWCMQLKGPLYTSVFNPLMVVLVALAGSFFLDEKLYLGSIIGAVLIVLGLYLVLWGKGEEMKEASQLVPSPTAVCPPKSQQHQHQNINIQIDQIHHSTSSTHGQHLNHYQTNCASPHN